MTIYASDTFAVDGFLSAHTSDSGHTWTVGTGGSDLAIVSAAVSAQVDFVVYYDVMNVTPPSADYAVAGVIHFNGSSAQSQGIVVRSTAAAETGYLLTADIVVIPGSTVWQLFKGNGSSYTSLGTWTGSVGASFAIQLRAIGSAITATVAGVDRISVTDGSITATGKPAIRCITANVDSARSISAFVVTDAGSAGSLVLGVPAMAGAGTVTGSTPSLVSVALNGTAIEALGLALTTSTGWHSIPQRNYARLAQPLRRGSRVLRVGSSTAARELALRFIVKPSSVTDRATRLDALASQFMGLVTVTTVDAPDRVSYGLLQTMPVTPAFPPYSFVAGLLDTYADCTIVCDDPLWYDFTPTVTAIPATTQGALATGTGPIRRMVVTISGPATNPVVILRDQSGSESQRMTLTGTLAGGDSLVIDCDAYTITRTSDGLNALRAGWLTGGAPTETFFELRPPSDYTLECAAAAMSVSLFRSWET